ncbi:LLM class F420-dependent oxidoreductase [Streptomyces sp. NPDC056831]|uniref:LLM class F420-dependent oxidoreductase n=1 Tax=Streptomyces sp. NPDC056831 TaxID=3345954 RepID=UPI00369E6ED2
MSDTTVPLKQRVGRYGAWSVELRSEDPARRGELDEAAAELEELGYGAIWLGNNSTADHAAPLIGATRRILVGTSVLNIWQQEAATTAAGFAEVASAHPGRYLVGLGVSHGPLVKDYSRPYAAMTGYLDKLDEAGVAADSRVLAALGPKMLKLSGERAAGAIPYLVTPEHTAQAREILGEGPLLAPELKVVLETDPAQARALARDALAMYLTLPNYTNNFLRHGFTEADLAEGGSDRLIDAVFAWGDEDRIRDRIDIFHQAGGDHVALQVLTGTHRDKLPREEWRRLASLLG